MVFNISRKERMKQFAKRRNFHERNLQYRVLIKPLKKRIKIAWKIIFKKNFIWKVHVVLYAARNLTKSTVYMFFAKVVIIFKIQPLIRLWNRRKDPDVLWITIAHRTYFVRDFGGIYDFYFKHCMQNSFFCFSNCSQIF